MSRQAALSPAQEKKLRAEVRKGTDLPGLLAFAAKHKIQASRTTLGNLLKDERDRPSPAEPAADLTLASLAEQVRALTARVDALRPMPQANLAEVATVAVATAERLSRDPEVAPNVRVMALDKLPELIRLAAEVRDAEADDDETDLFNAAPPAAPAPTGT